MKPRSILGQPSWRLGSDRVQLAISRLGGFIGPVRFAVGGRTVEPYSIPPWAGRREAPAGALGALRGDVFCLPFGGNQKAYRGERHPPHGEPFHSQWQFESVAEGESQSRLVLSLPLTIRQGRIEKEITLRSGESVIYQRHRIAGLSGRMSFGYHATLDFSRLGFGRLSTSRILFGKTQPANFEQPARAGYCSLKPETIFRRLDRVPRADGTVADLTGYPVEDGFENLVLLATDPRTKLAWTAVTFPKQRLVWYSLKDPAELTCTLLWLSNGGRHYAPWNGRHRQRLGLEEVTALPEGLAEAVRPNDFSRRGVAVCRSFRANQVVTLRSATGVCEVPRGFDRVADIRVSEGRLRLRADSGAEVVVGFDSGFFQ